MAILSLPKLPPMDSSLFFPDLINFHMQNNPIWPIWVYPTDQGVAEITFLEFGRAAHRIAHALCPGRAGIDGEVVVLIANCDTILHHAIVAGMSIAGLVPFPVSPRNSPAAVIDMMNKVGCSRIMTLYHAHGSLIDAVRAQSPGLEIVVEEAPTLLYAFPKLGHEVEADDFVPYPPSMSRRDPNATSIYIHSSGSTGFPKPIPHSYKVQIHWMIRMTRAFFCDFSPGDRVGTAGLPPFHAAGLFMQMFIPIASLFAAVVYPPQAVIDPRAIPIVPTSDNILDSVRRTRCKVVLAVPLFLEQWVASTEAVETLRTFDRVIYGGGPLADKIGDSLWAAGVNLCNMYSGTEFGCAVSLRERAEVEDGEWAWMRFAEDIDVRCVPQGDGTYEFQILTTDDYQLAVENLPDVRGYATSDLFVKHPTKNLWKIVGRADDVITLASGEKAVATPLEGIFVSSPLLQGAVMFGRERNRVGVLVEPCAKYTVDVRDGNAVAEFIDKIWPVVEEANEIAPTFARIFKEMVLVVDPKRPMIRTSKGTVQKKATIKAYEAEIDALYASSFSANGPAAPSAWKTEDVLAWLVTRASSVSQGRDLDLDADLFAQGFDSLSATYLRNQIVNALQKSSNAKVQIPAPFVAPNVIFENPTLRLIATRISSLVDERAGCLDPKEQHVAAMNAMIEKYSIRLSESTIPSGVDNVKTIQSDNVVLLTGTTGGLGSFLLSQLLQDSRVKRVYALNRPSVASSIEERQKSAFVDKGISVELLSSEKLVYVEADASQDKCGLSPELYDEILNSVTIIIHNAWRVDFNLSLSSFEPNIKATRNLVDLAIDSKYRDSLRLVFISSVGVAYSWDRARGIFPEEILLDPSLAVGSGYGESKYVCERIVAKSGLQTTSLRIGQITGGANGSWGITDWVPILIKSGIALGSLPNSEGVVSWMRSEDVAAAVLDVAFAGSTPQSLNIVNPQRSRWSDVMSLIKDTVEEQKPLLRGQLTIEPFTEWVARLERKAVDASDDDLVHIPAIKLLEVFRTMTRKDEELSQQGYGSVFEAGGLADVCTAAAQRVSSAVLNMQPVGRDEVHAWIRYWISKGFF